MISEASKCETWVLCEPSHTFSTIHIKIFSNWLNLSRNWFHFHFIISYSSLRVGVLGYRRNKEISIMWSWYYLILMTTNGCHTCFVPFDLHLITFTNLNKIKYEYNSIISPYNKHSTIMINIIAIHIAPMLGPNINLAFRDVPKTYHLCACIDQLLWIFGKSYILYWNWSTHYFLDYHARFSVI